MDPLATVIIVCLVIFLLLIKGVIKTFKKQPIVAILCIIFIFPIYLIWAFIELFTGHTEKG
jgi:hypothetical protein